MIVDLKCTQCGKLNKIDLKAVQTELIKFTCSDCQEQNILNNPQYQGGTPVRRQKDEKSIASTRRRLSPRAKITGLVVLVVLGILSTFGGRFILSALGVSRPTVRITSGEWAPYCSENAEHNGLALRIVTEAFGRVGVNVEYTFFPWDQAMENVKTGEWDGSAAWFRSPERENSFYISNPVVTSGYVFFYLKNRHFNWETMEDLRKYQIGATKGYDYGNDFQNAEKQGILHVERLDKDEMNFDNLLNGKIDIFPQDMDVGMNMLYDRYPSHTYNIVTTHPKRLREDPLHLLLTKRNPKNQKLMQLFNKGLEKLKASGDYDRYVQELRHGED